MKQYLIGLVTGLGIGMSIVDAAWIYFDKVQPYIITQNKPDRVQSYHIAPSKLESACKDLDIDIGPQKLYNCEFFTIEDYEEDYEMKPTEVVPKE